MNYPVPKCKKCQDHKHNSFLRGSHYCIFSAINKDDIDEWIRVYGRDMKTSPKWCPKRNIMRG